MSDERPPDPLGMIPGLAEHLDRGPVPDTSEDAQPWGEVKTGLRCAGCGERIVKGFEFVRVQVVRDGLSGQRAALRSTTTSCVRPECDYALRCAQESTALRPIEWQFLDDPKIAEMFEEVSSNGDGDAGGE